MRRWIVFSAVVGLVAAWPAVGYAQVAPSEPTESIDVCGPVPEGYARCFAEVVVQTGTRTPEASGPRVPEASFVPEGYSPAQIKGAYGFPNRRRAGRGQTIAVVSAFDAPTAEADLNVFSEQFGLPPCTTANGCFTKVDEVGGSNYPPVDPGWALETSLDTQWAHAIAPGAKILLVEADSNNFGDLLHAFQYATQHAAYVSNSYGGVEFEIQTVFDPLFVVPGVSDFFGSGDNGAGGFFPASSPEVIAVGGTKLKLRPNGSVEREVAWSGSGGGCSAYYSANPAQPPFSEIPRATCSGARAAPDVSLVADPATGVAVYDSTPILGQSGWFELGGTSASTPMVAARAAITGQVWDAGYVYSPGRLLRDIVKGNNGFPARIGYDLVTGRGSPIG